MVDPGQAATGGGQRPVVDVAHLLEHRRRAGPAVGTGRSGCRACHWANERCRTSLAVLAVEPRDQVDGQVVGGPEGRAQVRGRGRCDPGRLREGDLGRPGHDGVALLVQPAPAGAPGQLEVLPRGEGGAARPAVLGEALDHHRPCRHVDARARASRWRRPPSAARPRSTPPPSRGTAGPARRGGRPRPARGPRATRRSRGRRGPRRRAARPGARRPGGWRPVPARRSGGPRRAGPGARRRHRRRG